MSKESYIRGFCKAAEAAGVDPKALAKYAQQYKTDGYVPYSVKPGRMGDSDIDIPLISTLFGETNISAHRNSNPHLMAYPTELKEDKYDPSELALRLANPRHSAWFNAHTNALRKATQPLRDAGFGSTDQFAWSDSMKEPLKDAITKLYHDEMKRTTSAPPASVTSPAAITAAEAKKVSDKIKKHQ